MGFNIRFDLILYFALLYQSYTFTTVIIGSQESSISLSVNKGV